MVTKTRVKGTHVTSLGTCQLGQEFFIKVRNRTGRGIGNGIAVTATSASGGFIEVEAISRLKNSNDITFVGVTVEAIRDGGVGLVSIGPTGAPSIDRTLDDMSEWVTKHRFAWLPKRMDSGMGVWMGKYVERKRRIWGLAGEGSVWVEEDTKKFLPKEYTLWLLTQEA